MKKRKVGKNNEKVDVVQPWHQPPGVPPLELKKSKDKAYDNDPGIQWLMCQYKNQWKQFIPDLSEMSEPWPGLESEDGLRTEHLMPDYWESLLYRGPRDSRGFLHGVPKGSNTGVGGANGQTTSKDCLSPDDVFQPLLDPLFGLMHEGSSQLEDELLYMEQTDAGERSREPSPVYMDLVMAQDVYPQCVGFGEVTSQPVSEETNRPCTPQRRKDSSSPEDAPSPVDEASEREHSSDDMPLRMVGRPHQQKPHPKKKRTAYLVTPLRRQTLKELPPSPSPSYSLTPFKNPISPLNLGPDAKLTFFTSLSSLTAHVDKKTQEVDLEKIDARIRQFSFYGIYPEVDWLLELSRSQKAEDIRVIKTTKRALSLLEAYLKTYDDYKRLATEQVASAQIKKFADTCRTYLQCLRGKDKA